MSAVPVELHLPRERSWTWEDLQDFPDDNSWGYELVGGQLIVSPSPDSRHQSMVLEIASALRAACPADLKVFVAPFDYTPRPGYSLQPDVMVVRRNDVGPQRLEATPILVVEVMSPSSRVVDRSLKRLVYEESGVPAFWLVDPVVPSVTVFDLVDTSYVETARASGAEVLDVARPYPVRMRPVDLLDE